MERRTVSYVRVSTDEQAEEGYSLDAQEKQCRAYALAREWPEVAEVYCDPGVSGGTRDRPALNRLLEDARAGTIERVICTKLDRMSRRAVDLLTIEDELDQCGVERVYIKDSIDTSTPTGRLLRTVLAAVAELERDIILERTMTGKREAISKGAVWRPLGILGYRCIPRDGGKGEVGRLEIDEETAPLVRRIFQAVADGASLHAVAAQLNGEGVTTRRGGKMWVQSTIGKIIQNPTYWGQAPYGRQRRVRENGKTVLRKGSPDAVLYVAVPPLVSPELADAAQAMIRQNRATLRRPATRAEYLLGQGLLRCGTVLEDGSVCGKTMVGDSYTGGTRYRCTCPTPTRRQRHSVSGRAVEDAVWSGLKELLRDPDRILRDAEALADASSAQARELDRELGALELKIGEVATAQDRLLDLYLSGGLDRQRYTAKVASLDEKRGRFADQRAALSARRDAVAARQLPVAAIRDACAHLSGTLDTLTPDQKRHLLRTLFTGITATKDAVHMTGVLDSLTGEVAVAQGGLTNSTS
jgi:site-specific DNA recombinase